MARIARLTALLLLVACDEYGGIDQSDAHLDGAVDGSVVSQDGEVASFSDAMPDSTVSQPDAGVVDADSGVDSGTIRFDAGELHAICDGSRDLRFAARVSGIYQGFPEMMMAIGFSYIYVRGDCTYWSNQTVAAYAATRQGVLTESEAQELSGDFGYGHWEELNDSYSSQGVDGSTLELYDGRKRILCLQDGCSPYGPDAGRTLVSQFEPSYYAWLRRLAAKGDAFAGAVRGVAKINEIPPESLMEIQRMLIQWPFAWSLDQFLGDFASHGVSCSAECAADLRGLRTMYAGSQGILVPGALNSYNNFSIRVDDDPFYYAFWFRDSLPLEDDAGTIPFTVSAP